MAEALKFCRDCAYLLGRRTYIEEARNWKCAAKQNTKKRSMDLVTGGTVIEMIFHSCEAARILQPAIDTSCGPEGIWYEEYKQPDYSAGAGAVTPVRSKRVNAIELEDL